jgi:hypothetical protein
MFTRIIACIAALFSTTAIVLTLLGAAPGAALADTGWLANRGRMRIRAECAGTLSRTPDPAQT